MGLHSYIRDLTMYLNNQAPKLHCASNVGPKLIVNRKIVGCWLGTFLGQLQRPKGWLWAHVSHFFMTYLSVVFPLSLHGASVFKFPLIDCRGSIWLTLNTLCCTQVDGYLSIRREASMSATLEEFADDSTAEAQLAITSKDGKTV